MSTHEMRVHMDQDSKYIFSANDTISGTVHLKVLKDIDVKDIQVKLQCQANTKATNWTKDRKGEIRKVMRTESHEALYDVITVFPPPNVRDATRSSKPSFKLTPGVYQYPFRLRFPVTAHCGDPRSKATSNMQTSKYETKEHYKLLTGTTMESMVRHFVAPLPPCIPLIDKGNDSLEIRYSLKVSLHRTHIFGGTTRMQRVLKYIPPGPNPIDAVQIQQSKLFLYGSPIKVQVPREKGSTRYNDVMFQFGITTTSTLLPGTMPFGIHILSKQDPQSFTYETKGSGKVSTGVFYISGLEIGLVSGYALRASGLISQISNFTSLFEESRKTFKVDLAQVQPTKIPNSPFPYSIDITKQILGSWTLPQMIPTFSFCNVQGTHKLFVRVAFPTGKYSLQRQEETKLLHDITVLGPVTDNDAAPVPEYDRPPTTPQVHAEVPPAQPPRPAQAAPANDNPIQEEEQLPTYQEATANTPGYS